METKKQKIQEIKKELEVGCGYAGFVKNVGKVFFRLYDRGCVLRDVVYYGSIRHGLEFELLSLDGQYFAGSKEHAENLKEAFGGRVYPSEYCCLAEKARELYIWEKNFEIPQGCRYNPNPMDFDEAVEAIFS